MIVHELGSSWRPVETALRYLDMEPMKARTWVCQGQWFASFPALHLEYGQVADHCGESVIVYMGINHPELRSLTTKSILVIVALQVVHSVHALFVEYNQTFVRGPAKLDNLSLIPLLARTNSVPEVCRLMFGTDRKDQEAFSSERIQLYLRP
jgi:hypothetical protein